MLRHSKPAGVNSGLGEGRGWSVVKQVVSDLTSIRMAGYGDITPQCLAEYTVAVCVIVVSATAWTIFMVRSSQCLWPALLAGDVSLGSSPPKTTSIEPPKARECPTIVTGELVETPHDGLLGVSAGWTFVWVWRRPLLAQWSGAPKALCWAEPRRERGIDWTFFRENALESEAAPAAFHALLGCLRSP